MENEANSSSNNLRVASFSLYLKPHEDKEVPFNLQPVKTNVITARTQRMYCKRFFQVFRRVNPCLTKKAVFVSEMGSCGTKGDQFAFPILNSEVEISTSKKKQFEVPRRSIEEFGSVTMNKGNIMINLERNMSILTCDAIPKENELMSTTYDDVASDASSDLFEIENLSRSGSFAEFSSCYSDYYDENTTVRKPQKTSLAGLLGCRSCQSVNVAEPISRTTKKSKH